MVNPQPIPLTSFCYLCQNEYRGSEEERRDVLLAYGQHRGDMSRVFENVLVSEEAVDAHRFMDMIEEAVKQGRGAAERH